MDVAQLGARDSSGSSCGQKEVCSSASLSCVPVPGGDCWSEGAMRGLEARMLEALQLPAGNCEPLRFVRYRSSESFGPHHDAPLDGHVAAVTAKAAAARGWVAPPTPTAVAARG